MVLRQVLLYSLPLLGTQALLLGGNAAALFVLGHLGVDALGAAAAPLTFAAAGYALFSGCSAGVMIAVSRAKAAGETDRLHRIVTQAVLGSIFAGMVLGALGALFAPELLRAVNVSHAELRIALPYTELLALSLPATFAFGMYLAVLHGLHDPVAPPALTAAYTALYLVSLAFLHVGALSVPISSLAATLIVTIGASIVLYAHRTEFRLDVALRSFFPSAQAINEVLRVDLPGSVQYLAVALAEIALVSIANSYGARGGAAFTLVTFGIAVLTTPAFVFATTAAACRRSTRTALGLNLAIGGILAIALYLFAVPLLSAFIDDPQTVQLARSGLLIAGWSAFALGIGNVIAAELDGYGQSAWSAIVNLAGAWLVAVPCASILAARYGLDGVWYGYTAGYAAVALTLIAVTPLVLRATRREREPAAAADRAS